jgi:O-antigen/teichoic acid export membrane protein
MGTLTRLARHTTNYSIVSILATIAGLISFPILTRLLSVEEYGLLSLIGLLLSLVIAFGKVGLQHAAVRFYSEAASGRGPYDVRAYVATTVLGMAAVGAAATVLWAAAAAIVPTDWWSDPRVRSLLLFTSVLAFIRVIESAWVNQLRAEERSEAMAVYSVLKRYAVLVATLAALFFVSRDLWSLYGATIVTEAAAVLLLGAWMLKGASFEFGQFSWPMLKAMVAFGAPLIGTEVASVVLSMGDRYVIQHVLGVEALGVYAASYNLCDYVKLVLLVSIAAAVLPMILRIWEGQGAAAARAFLERFFNVYFLIAIPAVVGIAAVAPELLSVLASSKYRAGAELMHVLMLGMAFEAVVVACSAGLYVGKKSTTILFLGGSAALLNIVLNVLLVPRYGLHGAAWATLASFAALAVASYLAGTRVLPFTLPIVSAAKFTLAAFVMYAVITSLDLGSDAATLAIRVGAGAAVYAAMVLLIDASTRRLLRDTVRRIGAWRAAA